MLNPEFINYTRDEYGTTTGASNSYIKAIEILDDIFLQEDVFGMHGLSVSYLTDVSVVERLKVFVRQQEGAFRRGDESIFRLGRPNQQSYPKSRFCSAAVSLLLRFAQHQQEMNEADAVVAQIARPTAQKIGKALLQYFDLTREGTDETSQVKIRKGQSYFRRMVLANYNNECCITGLNVPQLLRASHIVAWADDPKNRMNPENGLCLSATYDAAFDQHLISFDDDYRMIVSQHIKDYYTADITKEYFQKREGQKLTIPTQFLPDKKLMEKHREKMVG